MLIYRFTRLYINRSAVIRSTLVFIKTTFIVYIELYICKKKKLKTK